MIRGYLFVIPAYRESFYTPRITKYQKEGFRTSRNDRNSGFTYELLCIFGMYIRVIEFLKG